MSAVVLPVDFSSACFLSVHNSLMCYCGATRSIPFRAEIIVVTSFMVLVRSNSTTRICESIYCIPFEVLPGSCTGTCPLLLPSTRTGRCTGLLQVYLYEYRYTGIVVVFEIRRNK
jgi:hypothetical protein